MSETERSKKIKNTRETKTNCWCDGEQTDYIHKRRDNETELKTQDNKTFTRRDETRRDETVDVLFCSFKFCVVVYVWFTITQSEISDWEHSVRFSQQRRVKEVKNMFIPADDVMMSPVRKSLNELKAHTEKIHVQEKKIQLHLIQ